MLERLSRALVLTPAEREHLFLLAQSRPPEVRYTPPGGVSAQVQRVLDSMLYTPAFVKTVAWDIVAWNHAATVIMTDYSRLPPEYRNLLRIIFNVPHVRATMVDWEEHARLTVATFRMETSRAGAGESVRALVDELCETSAEFARIWQDNDVRTHGESSKKIHHATAGTLVFDYANFAVESQPGLGMVVFTPSTDSDKERVRELIENA